MPTIAVTGLPTGITYSNGQITGTSTDTGTHGVTVTATNSAGSDTEMFDITVEAELTVPQIASIGDVTYAFNVEINEITVTATGNPIPSISVAGLPTGITYTKTELFRAHQTLQALTKLRLRLPILKAMIRKRLILQYQQN